MITLVTGGSGSGKSAYAEWLIMQSPCARRYYVATMIAYGREGKNKVRRHQELRRGKGFITLERPRNVGGLTLDQSGGTGELAAGQPQDTGKLAAGRLPHTDRDKIARFHEAALLLECVSNLAANEMFGSDIEDGRSPDTDCLADRITEDIRCLSGQTGDMVIVTNEVGRDGIIYERETMEYIRLMGLLNQRLSHLADRVVEVVYGIPVTLKPYHPICVTGGLDLRNRIVQREETGKEVP